jgi:hypothetical protein
LAEHVTKYLLGGETRKDAKVTTVWPKRNMSKSHHSPSKDEGDRTWARACTHILADPERVYALWRKVEGASVELSKTEERTRGVGHLNHKMLLKDEPGRRIVWKSSSSAFDRGGGVIFEEGPSGRGTLVTVLQEFRIGKVEKSWQVVTGRNPKDAIVENLRHFKARAEGEN